MDIQDKLIDLDTEIRDTLSSSFDDPKISSGSPRSAPPESLPDNLKEFYKQQTHLTYEWETKELVDAKGQKLQGRINILKAESVLQDWKGIAYFDDNDSDKLKTFKIVDNFIAEAHCGILQNEKHSDRMYFHESGEPQVEDMGVDFNAYLELMFAARGFWYWQRVILNLRNGKGYENVVEQFKTYMPQIFPDFKWEEFVALYERVRIK